MGLFYRIKQKRTDVPDRYRTTHFKANEGTLKKVMAFGDTHHIAVVGTKLKMVHPRKFIRNEI